MCGEIARSQRQAEETGLKTAAINVLQRATEVRRGARQNGKKSRFASAAPSLRLLSADADVHTGPDENNKRLAARTNELGNAEVKWIAYLPAMITTLFFLAASLLLGYIQ